MSRALWMLALLGCTENELGQLPDDKATPTPAISVDPSQLWFGEVALGETAAEAVTLTNPGSATLHVQALTVSGASGFALLPPAPLEIPAGEAAVVEVAYTAGGAEQEGALQVFSDAENAPELTVPLSGSAAYPLLSIAPDPHLFDWLEGPGQADGAVSLENTGAAPLTIDAVLVSGAGFSAEAVALPVTLAPSEALTVPVSFEGTEEGLFEGALWASSDAPSGTQKGALIGRVGFGAVEGRICAPGGDGWAVGARVFLPMDYNGDGTVDETFETRTDQDGRFTLTPLPLGTHTLQVEKGSFTAQIAVTIQSGTTELPEEQCLDPDSVKIAVAHGEFDHVEDLLSAMSLSYDSYVGTDITALITDPDALAAYDIVFFNCGTSFHWLYQSDVVAETLREYVTSGGSVYASDWAHLFVEVPFPNLIDFHGDDDNVFDPLTWTGSWDDVPYVGAADTITASVEDATMRLVLGDTAELTYDLEAWVVPVGTGTSATVLMRGDVLTWDLEAATYSKTLSDVPLAVRAHPLLGTVIYTSFHNEQQLTDDMAEALKEIILSL